MMEDPLEGRFDPGSKRERVWQALWAARGHVVSREALCALVLPAADPGTTLSLKIGAIRAQLLRANVGWSLATVRTQGYRLKRRF